MFLSGIYAGWRRIGLFFALLILYFDVGYILAATPPSITTLKNLYLNTYFVEGAAAQAVIVVPAGKYGASVTQLNNTFQSQTSVTLPVLLDTSVAPETLLQTSNVIVLGNRESNTFIRELYRQWYTFLDSKYPGSGGYVLRSLHNPFATGKNVIFVGGSDDAGVAAAADRLDELLITNGAFSSGWLMEISLSTAVQATLPQVGTDLGADFSSWNVKSWRDSYRTIDGTTIGYDPASYYGWNPISVAGTLYYMTGNTAYLDLYKQIAIPDTNNLPYINSNCYMFYDPADPLVKNYHYGAHIVDLIFDLIEESPQFTDAQRLFITDKLVRHQYEYKFGANAWAYTSNCRHGLYHSLCVYTGSRYFKKYYPNSYWDGSWDTPLSDARTKFYSVINDAVWAESDTLEWICTTTEPLFDFFMLDGFETFRDSGTADRYMGGLQVLWRGNANDDFHVYNSINMYNKAAEITQSGEYVWMRDQLGHDFGTFRIGQSWWPDGVTSSVPQHLVDAIRVHPLATSDWNIVSAALPSSRQTTQADSFQILSYRTGLTATDDYMMLDGFNGTGRNDYHINTVWKLRMFGRDILYNEHNDVDVLCGGTANTLPARASELKNQLATDTVMYTRTDVPNMTSSVWQRHLLMLKDNAFISIDKVTANTSDTFDIKVTWDFFPTITNYDKNEKLATFSDGSALSHTGESSVTIIDREICQRLTSSMVYGGSEFVGNIISQASDSFKISKINGSDNAFFLEKESGERAFIALGSYVGGNFSTNADFVYFDTGRVILANAQSFIVNAQEYVQNAPETRIIAMDMSAILASLNADNEPPLYPVVLRDNWQESWQHFFDGRVTHIVDAGMAHSEHFWAVNSTSSNSTLRLIDIASRSTVQTLSFDSVIMSVEVAKTSTQLNNFALLVGTKDDKLRAYNSQGTLLWTRLVQIDQSFVRGDSYEAPWFTDPTVQSGVYSIAVGNFRGQGDEIAVGRPCTLEYYTMSGTFIKRLPTEWGNNNRLVKIDTTKRGSSMLLTGKHYTGFPYLSGVNDQLLLVANSLFTALPSDALLMGGWMQKDCGDLFVSDLDNDGTQEVVYSIIGAWNELRVYNGQTEEVNWVKYFGGGSRQESFKHNLCVMDVNSDGKKDILVSPNSERLAAYDCNGCLLWLSEFPSVVCGFDTHGSSEIVAGLENGYVAALGLNGTLLRAGKIDDTNVRVVISIDGSVICGSESGRITVFDSTMPYKLLGNWRCDSLTNDTVTDSTVLANHGTAYYGLLLNSLGISGKSLDFDGGDDCVTVPHNSAYTFGKEATISVWLKPDSYPSSGNWSIFFDKTDYASGAWYGFYLSLCDDGRLSLTSNAVNFHSSSTAPLGQWSHICCTINADSCRLFINGQLVGSATTNSSYELNNTSDIHIGNYRPNNSHGFDGLIDEVRMYNVSMSAEDVNRLCRDSSLLGYWKGDSLGDNIVSDSTIVENDGIAYNSIQLDIDAVTGKSLKFDGGDDCVTVPHGAVYSFDKEATIAAWIKPDCYPASGNWSIFFDKTDYASGAWYGFYLSLRDDGRLSLTSNAVTFYSTAIVPLNKWSYVVCTINETSCSFYINSQIVGSATTNSTYQLNNTNEIHIGNYSQDNHHGFDGSIDEVRLYNRSLPSSEISAQYTIGHVLGDWRCDSLDGDSVVDNSEEENNGIACKGVVLDADGKIGNCLSFDGVDDYVKVAHNDTFVFDREVTISTWLNVSNLPTSRRIFMNKIDYANGAWYGFYLAMQPTGVIQLVSNAGGLTSTESVPTGHWVHVAVTINQTGRAIYINGQPAGYAATDPNNNYNLNNTNPLYIGNYEVSSTYTFHGKMDEIKIYKYAMSAAEIHEQYVKGQLIADWRCDSLVNNIVEDDSDAGNNCVAHNDVQLDGNGKIGTCLSFDGVDDYVMIGHNNSFIFDREVTLSTWLYISGLPSTRRIFLNKTNYANGAWYGFYLAMQTTGNIQLVSNAKSFISTSSVPTNQWTHVALTISDACCVFYINGEEAGNSACNQGYNLNNTNPLYLGNYEISSTYTFPGKMDETRIYKYAMNQAEITALYQNPRK